ncbi:hypothetical protein HDF25_004122 [Pedobacter cryoconitis]|uniref:Uncharacterized protein n=1 Tax=Pedobacter cryoconitis TaxID=188932 RepID=A0A7X0J6X3_9SPHI|nr:hypothetical protein [Pedobacter cryoconitis]
MHIKPKPIQDMDLNFSIIKLINSVKKEVIFLNAPNQDVVGA